MVILNLHSSKNDEFSFQHENEKQLKGFKIKEY